MPIPNKIFDMGYEPFAKRDELRRSLAFSIVSGLCTYGNGNLLCDFSIGQREYSARELLIASLALSRRLAEFRGQGRVGIIIPPCRDAFVMNYACIFAGIVPVNLNFTLGRVAAESCVATSKIKTMFCTSYARDKIAKANPAFPWTDSVVDVDKILAEIPDSELNEISKDASLGADHIMRRYGMEKCGDSSSEGTLVFTSGSEGAPKAAILTERNIIANCLQVKLSRVFNDSDVLLANLPIFHSFGLLFEVWYMAIFGQRTVTLISPLDIKNNILAVRQKGVTAIIGSPTFFRAYLKHASPEDMKTLRAAIAGAEKTPEGFHEMWNEKFGDTYREGYGLTEASPVVGVNLPERNYGYFSTGSRRGSIGKLFPGIFQCGINRAADIIAAQTQRFLDCADNIAVRPAYKNADDPVQAPLRLSGMFQVPFLKCREKFDKQFRHQVVGCADPAVRARHETAKERFVRSVDDVDVTSVQLFEFPHLVIIAAGIFRPDDILHLQQFLHHPVDVDSAARMIGINQNGQAGIRSHILIKSRHLLHRISEIDRWKHRGYAVCSGIRGMTGQLQSLTSVN